MIDRQKFRRVLFSRYGFLTVVSLALVFYILSFYETPFRGIPFRGSQVSKDNPFYALVYALVLVCPLGFMAWGWEKFDAEDRKRQLEENPHLKTELKEGESLIDFLYEDEHKNKN
jgi:hypothetical protein